MLSAVEGGKLGEQALLREITTYATKDMERMGFDELMYTVNMVFPYIHREQIGLWNRTRYQL